MGDRAAVRRVRRHPGPALCRVRDRGRLRSVLRARRGGGQVRHRSATPSRFDRAGVRSRRSRCVPAAGCRLRPGRARVRRSPSWVPRRGGGLARWARGLRRAGPGCRQRLAHPEPCLGRPSSRRCRAQPGDARGACVKEIWGCPSCRQPPRLCPSREAPSTSSRSRRRSTGSMPPRHCRSWRLYCGPVAVLASSGTAERSRVGGPRHSGSCCAGPSHPSCVGDWGTGSVSAVEGSPFFGPLEEAGFAFTQRLDRDGLIGLAASRSYVIALPDARRRRLLEHVGRLFDSAADADSTVELPYLARCWRCTRA